MAGGRMRHDLHQHGVSVPDVLANTDGELATVAGNGRAGPRSRVGLLFEWVAGRSLRTCVTQRRAAMLGRLSARLQQDAVQWSPPGAQDVLRADRVLYWQLPDQLAAAGARFGLGTLFTDTGGGYSESRPWPDVSPGLFDSLIAARACAR
jgi:Ser/Thr protein kinase RdoA (MazF antagonist)